MVLALALSFASQLPSLNRAITPQIVDQDMTHLSRYAFTDINLGQRLRDSCCRKMQQN